MSVVWKFTTSVLPGEDKFTVPQGSTAIHVEQQGEDVAVWYLVPNDTAPLTIRKIVVVMTGEEFDTLHRTLRHVGSVSCHGFEVDPFVLHIFEEVR